MAVAYPSNIPLPLVKRLSSQTPLYTRSNDTITGPPVIEFLTDARPVRFNASWSFDQAEFEAFETWWDSELTKGSKAFDIDLPTSSGIQSHECYLQTYREILDGERWKISGILIAIQKVFPS